MEGKIHENTILYQSNIHHREQLRQKIDPDLIDKLEINNNPSAVGRRVYKSVYLDELDKEMQNHRSNLPYLKKSDYESNSSQEKQGQEG